MRIIESIVPAGEIGQRPYVSALLFLFLAIMLSHLLTAPAVTARVGILPFVVSQLLLLWWWFALIAKRLRDAERSILGVAAVAFISLIALMFLAVMLLLQFTDGDAGDASRWIPASGVLLLSPLSFAAGVICGPAPFNPQDLQVALLALLIVAPLLLTVWYSVWAAVQPSALKTG